MADPPLWQTIPGQPPNPPQILSRRNLVGGKSLISSSSESMLVWGSERNRSTPSNRTPLTWAAAVRSSMVSRSMGGSESGPLPTNPGHIALCSFGKYLCVHALDRRRQHAARLFLCDRNRIQRIPLLDCIHYILSLGHLPENGMFSIQPLRDDVGNKKLAAVPVIGRHSPWRANLQRDGAGYPLPHLKLIPWASRPVSGWITALDHEIRNDPVKNRPIIKPSRAEKRSC